MHATPAKHSKRSPRGKATLAALFALAVGTQALAPTPAGAVINQSAVGVCTPIPGFGDAGWNLTTNEACSLKLGGGGRVEVIEIEGKAPICDPHPDAQDCLPEEIKGSGSGYAAQRDSGRTRQAQRGPVRGRRSGKTDRRAQGRRAALLRVCGPLVDELIAADAPRLKSFKASLKYLDTMHDPKRIFSQVIAVARIELREKIAPIEDLIGRWDSAGCDGLMPREWLTPSDWSP